MQYKILVVDDDQSIVEMLDFVLKSYGYNPVCFTSSIEALSKFEALGFDAVLSDFFMPDLDGSAFFYKIKSINPEIPFIFLTANTDIQKIVELFKDGLDDYMVKPVANDEIVFRIGRIIELKKSKKIAERIEREKRISEMETKKLVNWRLLYAYKGDRTLEQTLTLLRRNMDQAGGYIWLDILKNGKKDYDDNYYLIEKPVIDLIEELSEKNKEIFELITFISGLDDLALNENNLSISDFYDYIVSTINDKIGSVATENGRRIRVESILNTPNYNIRLDLNYFEHILNELIINAIKYSPEKSDIDIVFDFSDISGKKHFNLTVRNLPREMNARDLEGNTVFGIPYDYSELVFDLFYTIESYTNRLKHDEWCDGSGLYICRKLLTKMHCLIETSNGIDYSSGIPSPFVNVTITIPVIL